MLRKITSLTSFLSFLVLCFTSVVLYFVPQGKVAYWAMWKFLGLSKEQWGDIHINIGVLFLAVSLIHIWLNWRPITAYLKDKARNLSFRTPAFLISLILTLFVTFGTLAGLPPMQQVLDFAAYLKTQGEIKYGNPPYGHAELSPLSIFCKRTGLDLQKAVASLRQSGVKVDSSKETILNLSRKSGLAPGDIHKIILRGQPDADAAMQNPGMERMSDSPHSAASGMPSMRSGAGLGRMTLEEYCDRYGMDLDKALKKVREEGAEVDKHTSIREIAGQLGMSSPMDMGRLLHP